VPDTHELAAALAADLDSNFERLVRSFQDRLFAFALGWSGCAQDAEEITQDAFVRAYRALGRYPRARREALALRPWLYRITLNVAHNRARGQRLATERLAEDEHDVPDPSAEQPEASLVRGERRRDLRALVVALPERYRAAVVLRHVQGLSYQEAAAVLKQPVGTTKSDVHRGLRLLRAALDQQEELIA
jgi:RNA polymerase sigma-70 factor, ECF subfamily